jgi:hypothetical protein
VVDEAAVVNVLLVYPQSKLDYPDVPLCELARQEGASVLSFERKLAWLGLMPFHEHLKSSVVQFQDMYT